MVNGYFKEKCMFFPTLHSLAAFRVLLQDMFCWSMCSFEQLRKIWYVLRFSGVLVVNREILPVFYPRTNVAAEVDLDPLSRGFTILGHWWEMEFWVEGAWQRVICNGDNVKNHCNHNK